MFLGACGLLFAFAVGSANDGGAVLLAAVIAFISLLFIFGGYGARKSAEHLASSQDAWDKTWLSARCGYQWQE
jgi:hypothetical protein